MGKTKTGSHLLLAILFLPFLNYAEPAPTKMHAAIH